MTFMRLFLFLSVLSLTACNSNRVVSFNNPDFASRSYESYRIITRQADTVNTADKAVYEGLHKAVIRQLDERGYRAVQQNSDLLVRYQLYANNRVEQVANNNLWAGRFNNFNNPNNVFFSSRNITESILLIGIHDRKARKLVWQGSLDLNYSVSKKRKFEEVIPEIVEQIFASYQQ